MYLLRGLLTIVWIVLNTVVVCALLLIVSIVRALSWGSVRRALTRHADGLIWLWTGGNKICFQWLHTTKFDIHWLGQTRSQTLSKARWYAIVSNHQTWTDILVLQTVLFNRTPPVKFFTKSQLIWVPFIGVAMWALGFPYVKRISKEKLAAQPELRYADRDNIFAACERFKNHPTSILNFLEGTRFTAEKHAALQSSYAHLLPPKPGGLGYVLSDMTQEIDTLVDVTIHYPGNAPDFWAFLQGRCPHVRVEIEAVEVPEALRSAGSTGFDERQKALLVDWLQNIWRAKDARLGQSF